MSMNSGNVDAGAEKAGRMYEPIESAGLWASRFPSSGEIVLVVVGATGACVGARGSPMGNVAFETEGSSWELGLTRSLLELVAADRKSR